MGMNMSGNRSLPLLLASLSLISTIAIALSYISVSSLEVNVTGSLLCDGEALLVVTSGSGGATVYYVSVIEGDHVVELRRVNAVLSDGESLRLRLKLPEGSKVSVLLDKGVIPNLSCGARKRSQP